MTFEVDMGSAQTFNQIEMDSGGYPGDYARGYNVEVSSNGFGRTEEKMSRQAICTGTVLGVTGRWTGARVPGRPPDGR